MTASVLSSDPVALPILPLAVYRLDFTAQDSIRLPAYAGSAWRGVFGRALKRLVCVTREPACPPCLLYRSCVYPYLFETPPPERAEKLRKYPAAPHPFVIEPWPACREVAPRAAFGVDLVLIGDGVAQAIVDMARRDAAMQPLPHADELADVLSRHVEAGKRVVCLRPGSGFTDASGRALRVALSERGHACEILPGAVWPDDTAT